MIYRTQVVSPGDVPEWDRTIGTFPNASFFHSSAWAEVLRETYGFRPRYFIRGPLDAPKALFPVMEVDSLLTGKRGVSLPFSDRCDPLFHDPQDARELWKEVVDHAHSHAWKHIEVRGEMAGFLEAHASTEFYGHILDLDRSEEEIRKTVEPSVRRAIRKAELAGLTTEVSQTLEATIAFYRLLGLARRRHGVPLQPLRFFRQIHRSILSKNLGCVALVRRGKVPIAGAMYLYRGKTVVYKFGGSDHAYQHLRGNNLAMWEAIGWHLRRGFTQMDFGRTSLQNEGLRSFKRSWGTVESRLEYYRYGIANARWTRVPDASANRLAPLFRSLPLSLSRLVGSLLYRHIA